MGASLSKTKPKNPTKDESSGSEKPKKGGRKDGTWVKVVELLRYSSSFSFLCFGEWSDGSPLSLQAR